MPDGVDTLVESMETPRFHSSLDGSMGVAEPPELSDRNDAVLPIRETRQFLTPGQSFCTHKVEKLCREVALPPRGELCADYAGV